MNPRSSGKSPRCLERLRSSDPGKALARGILGSWIPLINTMKFLTDINLGKLALRLRMLGYDTAFYRGAADRTFLRKAQSEERVVLTRKRELAGRQFQGTLLVVENDRVERQVEEVLEKLRLTPKAEGYFSRCLRCNVLLEELARDAAKDRVPPYVFEQYARFQTCPLCGRVYWPGTHIEDARRRLRALRTPSHPP